MDHRDPELLRKAAQALDSAQEAEAKALESERTARRLRSEADGLMAAARRMYADANGVGLSGARTTLEDPPEPPLSAASIGGTRVPGVGATGTRSVSRYWNDGSPTAVGWAALVLAILALLLGLWLWMNRGDTSAVKRTADQAFTLAKDANGKIDNALAPGGRVEKIEKAANQAAADASQAKADAASAVTKCDNACPPPAKKKGPAKGTAKQQPRQAGLPVAVPPPKAEAPAPKVASGAYCTNQAGVNPKAVKNDLGCTCYVDNTQGEVLKDFFINKAQWTISGAQCKKMKDDFLASLQNENPKVRLVNKTEQERRSWNSTTN